MIKKAAVAALWVSLVAVNAGIVCGVFAVVALSELGLLWALDL